MPNASANPAALLTPADPGSSAAAPIVPASPLVPAMAAGVVAGAGAAYGLAQGLGWRAPAAGLNVGASAAAGALAIATGVLVGLAILWPARSRTMARFGPSVLAASAARMLVGLAAGLIVFFAAKPEPYTYFSSLCAAFVAALAVETIWARAALRRGQQGRGSERAGACASATSTPTLREGVVAR